MSLKQEAVSGVGWSTISKFGEEVIRAIVMIVLARLLTPDAFGLIGMIMVFSGFVNVFRDAGFGPALIQTKELTDIQISSVFWVTVGLGMFLTVLLIGASPLIAYFYDNPALTSLTMGIAFNFLIQGFAIVQRSLFKRDMDFKGLAIVKVTAALVGGAVAVIMAYFDFGVWSLVGRRLVSSFGLVGALWAISDWKPSFSFSWVSVKELLGFSGNLTGFNVFNYWVRKVDDLLVGRFLGSGALGLYTRAYSVMLFPLQRVSRVVGKVMFPALTKIQDDIERTKRVYLKSLSLIALITFPLMLGLLVTTEHLVLAVLGSQWEGIIILLRLLSIVGMSQSIGTTTGWIYQAQGRTDWMFRWGIFSGIIAIVSYVIGLRWGLIGITVTITIRHVPMTYLNFAIPGRLIDMTFTDVARSVSGVFSCSAVMAGVVWVIGMVVPEGFSHWAYLGIQVPAGVILYLLLVYVFKLQPYKEFIRILNEQWERKR